MFPNNVVSIEFQLLLIVLVFLYAVVLFRSRLNPKVIRRSALTILAAGTALHMYGLILEGYSEGIITTFFRSVILTLKMFVYDGDLIDINAGQHTPLFLDLYFFIFYAAMLTSLSAIIMLFGKHAMTTFQLLFRRKKFRHVFIGVNSRSEMIARGITENTAFIEFPSDSEDDDLSVGKFIRNIAGDEGGGRQKRRRNIVILQAKRRLALVDSCDNVFETIGLDRLKRLVDSNTAFYILSEDLQRNLDDLMTLLADKDLTDNTIHVCLSREGVARYYKTTLKSTGAHFIYPSSLAVVELMKNRACHPVSVMQPEMGIDGRPSGAASGEFNAMVVGFGETGQAVTKFLYEFSSAVLKNGQPLPVSIVVNDERIESLKGQFVFDSPDMDYSGILKYENYGTESSEFWDRLMERIDTLDYIAISMNDDAANLDLACTIFMYALKKRKNGMKNFRIVVRKKYTLSHERELVAKMNEKAGCEVIVCYGEYDKVFTPEMIISKSRNGINHNAIILADRISSAYTAVSGKNVSHDARMELHQLISRANHVASISMINCGERDVTPGTLENLARMEHLRYSRYLAAHGYSYSTADDDVLKTTHQICDWDDLTEQDRQYHRDMVRAQLLTMQENS